MRTLQMKDWRKYRVEDEAQVRALFERQSANLGLNFAMPDLSAAPMVIVMVQEVDGKVERAFTVEAVAECCAIADGPIPAEEMNEVLEQTHAHLLTMGFTLARAAVPSKLVIDKKNGKPGAMRRYMKGIGFTEEDGSLKQFYRWL